MDEKLTPGHQDFTDELADMILFMSDVAIDIRMHTPYNSSTSGNEEEHAKHILWLSDSIHFLSDLATAVKNGNLTKIITSANDGIRYYQKYLCTGGEWVSDPMLTFREYKDPCGFPRHNQILDRGIALFERIKDKAQAYLALGDARRMHHD